MGGCAGQVSNPEQNAMVKGFPTSQHLAAATSKATSGNSSVIASSLQRTKLMSDSLIVLILSSSLLHIPVKESAGAWRWVSRGELGSCGCTSSINFLLKYV